MKIKVLNENKEHLKEYFYLCMKEWGNSNTEEELKEKSIKKVINLLNNNDNNEILILELVDNKNNMLGFISLFKTDGEERIDLTPWYATMYVKKEYRKRGYSKMLNDALLYESRKLGYKKVYLKSNLVNYYEKFGAKYIEKLSNGENLFYIEL